MPGPIWPPPMRPEEAATSGKPAGPRRRSRGLVFTVLLCVWLSVVVGFWTACLTGYWVIVDMSNARLYFGTLTPLLLGVYLPGQEGARAMLRRALVMVPVSVAGCQLILGAVFALNTFNKPSWWSPVADMLIPSLEYPWLLVMGGFVLGLGLTALTRRVPFGRLLVRSWLALFVGSCATGAAEFWGLGVCAARKDLSTAEEVVVGMIIALIVLSWTVAFGLAVGATRDRNAAPPGGPELAEPPRAER